MFNSFPMDEFLDQEKLCLIMRLRDYLLRKDKLKSSIPAVSPPKNRRPKLHEKMLKAIHDIYSRDKTFIDFLAHDLDDSAVWFNSSEFARFHDLDGEKVLSILTSDTRSQPLNIKIGDGAYSEGVSKSRLILLCRAQEISGLNAEQPLRVDGKLYTISEARLIQDQVWRIVLEANDG